MIAYKGASADLISQEMGVVLCKIYKPLIFLPEQRLYRKQCMPDDMLSVKPVTYSVIKAGLIGLTRYLANYC